MNYALAMADLPGWFGWFVMSISTCVLGVFLGIAYARARKSRRADESIQEHRDFPRP